MGMESKGIFLYIWGKPQYGMMAYQLAMSIKYHSPSIHIHLLTDQIAVSRLRNLSFFDTIEYTTTPNDPAQAKIDMYDRLPFDHNIFLDADGLCLGEMDSLFERFMGGDKPFSCFVYGYYNQNDPDVMPLMVWADRNVIWDHYGLSEHTLPATQSSLLYIRKGDKCREIYSRMRTNYINRIPLEKLRNKWGGGQPDELYLNVTLAQMGYDPQAENVIYFADNTTFHPHQLKHQYKILSLFGTSGNVKPMFERFYNKEVSEIGRQLGAGITYEWKALKNSKHANIRQVLNKKGAFQNKFVRSEKLPDHIKKPDNARTLLFTSYFDSGNRERQEELNKCLQENLNNPAIDHVYVYSESDKIINHPKLTVRLQGRPTYQNLIDWANDLSGPLDVVVIANSDIYFDNTVNWPHMISMRSVMIALSRWDVAPNGSKKLFAYEHSQDTWIFKGKIEIKGLDYYMGLPGCDNRIAFDADHQGYRVVNCAKDIITYHIHNSNVRSYTQEDRLEGSYLPVFITSIRDIKTNRLLLKQPGKVGDIIRCAPIAKYYADRGYEVEWEAPSQYHSTLYNLHYTKPVTTATGEYSRVIDISFGLNRQSPTNIIWYKRRKDGLDSFVTLKYELAGVPVSECNNLVYTRNEAKESELYNIVVGSSEPYALVHSGSDYGGTITADTDLSCIQFVPYDGYSIFDWRKVIENATEIHCIDSSLVNFVDAINPKKPVKYYYPTDRVPMQADRTLLFNQWQYNEKYINVTA